MGLYSADDFICYDLTDDLLDYLAEAFDDDHDPAVVIPLALSIWLHEPEQPNL